MPDWTFQAQSSGAAQAVEQVPGAFRRVLADGDRMMVIEWTMNAGVVVPLHNHPHEQSGYVISGEMVFTCDGKENRIMPGMGYAVAGNVPHGARFPVPTVIIDIFSPPREDYRGDKPSTYTLTPKKPAKKAAPKKKAAAKPKPSVKSKKR